MSEAGPHEESVFDEKPSEFFASVALSGGFHDGQAVVPDGDHYRCWCTCGEWAAQAPTEAEGLRLARVHTGSLPG